MHMKFNIELPIELNDEPKKTGRKTILIEKELEDELRKVPKDFLHQTTRDFWRALVSEFQKKQQSKAS